jgi:hypothetical protein
VSNETDDRMVKNVLEIREENIVANKEGDQNARNLLTCVLTQ